MHLKHTLISALMLLIMSLPTMLSAQTTEGKDFWVSFLMADQNDVSDSDATKKIHLQLSISAKENATVTVKNEVTGQTKSIQVNAGEQKDLELYVGTSEMTAAPVKQLQADAMYCYSVHSERVDSSAIHVTSTGTISLFAANRRDKSFDATNVLPTSALLDEYIISSYPPSDHGDAPQGTHFAIVATEDNTVVDYVTTALTDAARKASQGYVGAEFDRYQGFTLGDTITTPVLMKGQVYYVWSGQNAGVSADLTGTFVKARDGKRIAVFQGAPHTNIPDKIRDRDHLFSQAMPVRYWGNTFAITASMTRHRDIVAVQALEDGTEVYVNGNLVHTFNFASEPSRTYRFEIGSAGSAFTSKDKNKKDCTLPDPLVTGTSCYVQTSCAASTHIFMVSNQYDANAKGDPAMVWVNPIEQQISDITFATYGSSNQHYVNIVTSSANVASMMLDGNSISSHFAPVAGSNSAYYFARESLTSASHNLHSNGGFIAHVYGYGDKESYGYSAGGAARVLEQFVEINGERFTAESNNTLCGKDTIGFKCDLNYEVTNITWGFGDGSAPVSGTDTVAHYYAKIGDYDAYVLIDRESSNLCRGSVAHDSIPIRVHIGRLEFAVTDTVDDICSNRELMLYFTSTGTALTNQNCTFTFNEKAQAQGFTASSLSLQDDYFLLNVPNGVEQGDGYAFTIKIETGCGDTTASVGFTIPFDPSALLVQRWDNVMLVLPKEQNGGYEFVEYQWYKNGEVIPGEDAPVLNLHEETDFTNEYYVRLKTAGGDIIETCPLHFKDQTVTEKLDNVAQEVTTIQGVAGSYYYIATTAEGTADLYDISGKLLTSEKLLAEGGYVKIPSATGFYVLKVKTANEKMNFKVYVQ